jgi:hypothetical protein
MFDPELFGQAMGDAIKSAVAPLQAKIANLEKQLAERPDVAALVSSEVSKAVAALPAAKDGKDCDMAAVKVMVDEAVKSLPTPKDGKDADPAEVAKMVKAAVDALPKPQDGKSITVEEVVPLIKTEVEKAVALIPVPKDGAGVAGAVIDRDGNLNLTLTNGEVKNLGRVEGKDGQNGKDGLGFDDLQVEYDGERTVTLKLVRDGIVKEANIKLPVVLDRGVFKEGVTYDAADGVTWGGSYWIAKKATGTRPGEGNDDWRLSVKKGRDGKDGRDGIDFSAPVNLKGEK